MLKETIRYSLNLNEMWNLTKINIYLGSNTYEWIGFSTTEAQF